MIGILLIIYAGLEHAFEVDHLLAVNNLVTNRTKIKEAVKDGIYWGIGHTMTIFVVGVIMIGFKVVVDEHVFNYLEAAVGIMLIGLGIYRLMKLFKRNKHTHTYSHSHVHTHINGIRHTHLHSHTYSHSHSSVILNHEHPSYLNNYKAAFSIGLVHGLAGSGALVVLVLTQMQSPLEGLIYILIFGVGSILGMFLASGLFSLPFTKGFLKSPKLQYILVIISSLLCVLYGFKVVYENLLGV